jgi:hypothetical protein
MAHRSFAKVLLCCAAIAHALVDDPRLLASCRDAIRPPPSGWGYDPPRGEYRVFTREDEIAGRATPPSGPQFAVVGAPLCVGRYRLVMRKIAKNASQSLNALVDAIRRRHGSEQREARGRGFAGGNCSTPVVFAFVRHPFSRLVSALNTVLRMCGFSRRTPHPSPAPAVGGGERTPAVVT